MNHIELADLSFLSLNHSDGDQTCNPSTNVSWLGGSTIVWSGEREEEQPRPDEEEPDHGSNPEFLEEPMEAEEADGEIDELMEIEHEPIMEQNYVGAGLSTFDHRNVERQCAQVSPPPSPVAGSISATRTIGTQTTALRVHFFTCY